MASKDSFQYEKIIGSTSQTKMTFANDNLRLSKYLTLEDAYLVVIVNDPAKKVFDDFPLRSKYRMSKRTEA